MWTVEFRTPESQVFCIQNYTFYTKSSVVRMNLYDAMVGRDAGCAGVCAGARGCMRGCALSLPPLPYLNPTLPPHPLP